MPPCNFLHESHLDYLIEIVDSNLFGQPMYASIQDKASVYLFNIISNHIFTDGNKRTGLDACLLFLAYNNYKLSDAVSDQILTDFILEIASGIHTLQSVQDWVALHTIKK